MDKVRPQLKLCGDPSEAVVQGAVISALMALPEVAIVLRTNSGGFSRQNAKGKDQYYSFIRIYSRLAVEFLTPHYKNCNELVKAKLKAPDIAAGMLKGGRFFCLEIKKRGKKALPGQAAFLDIVKAHGGIAAVVYSVGDAVDAIRGK